MVPFADAMPVGIEVAAETGSARVVTRTSGPSAFHRNILGFRRAKKGLLLRSLDMRSLPLFPYHVLGIQRLFVLRWCVAVDRLSAGHSTVLDVPRGSMFRS